LAKWVHERTKNKGRDKVLPRPVSRYSTAWRSALPPRWWSWTFCLYFRT
jgi:hypothetical protein